MSHTLPQWARGLFAAFAAMLCSWAPCQAQTGVLDDITVVDLARGEVRAGQRVMWRRSRIVAVGPRSSIAIPPDAHVIAGAGKFVMPGLWDMHVHLLMPDIGELDQAAEDLVLPLFIAHGVTGVRDMGDLVSPTDYRASTIPLKRQWDGEVRAGLRVGPRVLAAASFLVDGPADLSQWPHAPAFFGASSAESARTLVNYLKDERGVDFIKVYSGIPAPAYFALMDEARRVGVVVAGHKPLAVSFIESADAGQKSIEHAREILLDSFPRAQALRQATGERNLPPEQLARILQEHDPRMLQEILAALVRNGTYYVPTHLTRQFDSLAAAGSPSFHGDPRLDLLHPALLKRWRDDAAKTRGKIGGPRDARTYEQFLAKGLEVTRQAHEAGVRIMAGTDAGDSWCFHGSGLHDELTLLVRAGLSPLAALRAATIVPAEYVGRSADFGAIAPGYMADLIVLRANPLRDIGNTRAIDAVILNGRVSGRDSLNQMIAGVARKARALRGADAARESQLRTQ